MPYKRGETSTHQGAFWGQNHHWTHGERALVWAV